MIGVGQRLPALPAARRREPVRAARRHAAIPARRRGQRAQQRDLFADGLGEFFEEGHTCPRRRCDRYAAFSGHGSRFVDDVRSWQTVEPAIDFTAVASLAFALS